MKYPKPSKNFSKKLLINTVTIQEQRTVINSIYAELKPPTKDFNQ